MKKFTVNRKRLFMYTICASIILGIAYTLLIVFVDHTELWHIPLLFMLGFFLAIIPCMIILFIWEIICNFIDFK